MSAKPNTKYPVVHLTLRDGVTDVEEAERVLQMNEFDMVKAKYGNQRRWPFWRPIRILCTIWFFAVSIPCWIIGLSIAILLYPTSWIDPKRNLITWVCEMAMYIPCKLMPLWRFKYLGGHPAKFPERSLLVSNHSSFLDICGLLTLLPFHCRFISMKAVGTVPVVGQLMAMRRDILVDFAELKSATDGFRCTNRHSVLDGSKNAVKAGDKVFIFPEGWITRDGKLRYFKDGFIEIALETRCHIIPCAVVGSSMGWPADSLPDWGTVYVKFGPPIDASQYENTEEDFQRLRVRTKLAVATLRAEMLEQVYGIAKNK